MKFSTRIGAFSIILATFLTASAQQSRIAVDKSLVYHQKETPSLIDNYLFSSYYCNGKDAYNLKSFKIAHLPENINVLKINPAGYSFAVLSTKKDKGTVTVFDLNTANRPIGEIKGLAHPTALCYTADSRTLIVADGNSLVLFDAKSLQPQTTIPIDGIAQALATDPDGYFIAVTFHDRVDIINKSTGLPRKSLPAATRIADVEFSETGSLFGILTSDGSLSTYDTHDFSLIKLYDGLGKTSSLSFHPDNKYAAVATDGNRIQFVNLVNENDRPSLSDSDGPNSHVKFLRDGKDNLYVAYDTHDAIKYKRISGFLPNYTKMMRDELNERMREWAKMKPFETEEEYARRVNEESMERQKRLFANEIATSLAGDLISHSNVTLGRYNPQTGALTVSIGQLPAIYLNVPKQDMASFGNGANLQFSNAVYGISPDDKFELIYVDVFNPSNGKTYVFDNLDRQNLDFLLTDDSFVSLDLIKQSTREDVVLKGIKDKIVDDARARNLISDHTNIEVDTRIIPSYDASGERINNYRVDFSYTVEKGFSEREDFPAGKFRISDSNAASSMLRIIRQAFENDFAGYIVAGKRLNIEITGTADALPINGKIAYGNDYGSFVNEPAKVDGNLTAISVDSRSGIRTNEQLAFIRAQALRDYLQHDLPTLAKMTVSHSYNISVSKNKGGEFRRINVSFIFIDAM